MEHDVKKFNLLLPISGEAKRFQDVGYVNPKSMIDVLGFSIIEWSMKSINIDNANMIFVVRREHIDKFNIDEFLKNIYGNEISIVVSETKTDGAVNTCLLAKEYIDNKLPLIIFTPDCYFIPQINLNDIDERYDGLLTIFNSSSDMHSYVKLDNDIVIRTAEKEVISNNAVAGLYYFKEGSTFVKYGEEMIHRDIRVKNEFYICPVYNLLIENNLKIGITKNSKHWILGSPEYLEKFKMEKK